MTDIIAHAKSIVDLIKKYDDQELYRKIVDLQGEILEQSGKVLELTSVNRQLREKLDQRVKLTFKRPFYYSDDDTVPFCAHCWETKQVLIHLETDNVKQAKKWLCPACDACWKKTLNAFQLKATGNSVNPFGTNDEQGVAGW